MNMLTIPFAICAYFILGTLQKLTQDLGMSFCRRLVLLRGHFAENVQVEV